ncbi:putative 3-methyladenine DNA glycosylase isoform X2 [Thrips palmi]|uniref:DNA-3-methyladenine glycosylase II n=1 Tax=Thrips palmi TaxID=161013 RepID=A0A6P8ZNG7_THRPL|nr:putative 3-methyladenine DNA glycosylase isoform X2 [Thrips palmi]
MPAFPRIKLSSLRRRNVDFCSGNPSAFSDSAVDDNKRQKVTKKDAACGTDSPVESRVETSQKTIGQSQEDVRSTVPATAACGDDSFVGQECLKDSFYDVPCEQLATALLGKVLVRRLENGQILKGRIVETECYLGGEDKASHSYRGKMTERNAPMFMKPGTAYVYFTYGMYHCFNISSQEEEGRQGQASAEGPQAARAVQRAVQAVHRLRHRQGLLQQARPDQLAGPVRVPGRRRAPPGRPGPRRRPRPGRGGRGDEARGHRLGGPRLGGQAAALLPDGQPRRQQARPREGEGTRRQGSQGSQPAALTTTNPPAHPVLPQASNGSPT